ncbi:MAG: 5-formyltetrahydrofolate cyclo-ligase [bacterium]
MDFQTKEQIRKKAIADRLALTPEEVRAKSSAVRRNLVKSGVLEGRNAIALYAAAKGEVDTRPLFDLLRAEGRTVALPRVRGKGPHIDFFGVKDWEKLEESRLGIPEPPAQSEPVSPALFDLVLVPAVAFDRQGKRVGFGMGCYDRFLKRIRAECLAIGLGYDFQLYAKVPAKDHDVPLTGVITESEVILPEVREKVGHINERG